jgi:hypothetical protein
MNALLQKGRGDFHVVPLFPFASTPIARAYEEPPTRDIHQLSLCSASTYPVREHLAGDGGILPPVISVFAPLRELISFKKARKSAKIHVSTFGYRLSAIGYWLLAIGYWLFGSTQQLTNNN